MLGHQLLSKACSQCVLPAPHERGLFYVLGSRLALRQRDTEGPCAPGTPSRPRGGGHPQGQRSQLGLEGPLAEISVAPSL